MKKRILCAVFAALILSSSVLASAATFTDVKEADWYHGAVEYVSSNGIMGGTSATEFGPKATTTRGMIVTILHRMAGSPAGDGASFTDVAADKWYAAPIAWATGSAKIAGGVGNNLFAPDKNITREQIAVLLYNYAKYCGKSFATSPAEISSFDDAGSVSSWAVEALKWACGAKLIGGSNNKLNPKGEATRAEVATMIQRFIEAFGKAPSQNITGDLVSFNVGFDNNDGIVSLIPTVQVFEGGKVEKPADPTREGYTFVGWFTAADGGEEFDFSAVITESMTLFAHWTQA